MVVPVAASAVASSAAPSLGPASTPSAGAAASADAIGPVLALDHAVALGMAHSPTLDAAREAKAAAWYRVDQARAGFFPQLILSLGYRRATMNSSLPPYDDALLSNPATASFASLLAREGMDNYDNWSATATINQTIWDGMRTIGTFQAAKALAEGVDADNQTSKDTVSFAVIQAYFLALAAQDGMATAEEIQRQMERHLYVAREQLAVDVRQRIDVTRAEADLASANLSLLRARNGYDLARISLNATMGIVGPATYRVERPSRAEDEAIPAVDEAVRQALSRRPEYRSLEAKARASEHLITVASSGWWPTVVGSASWAQTEYKLNDMAYNWGVGVSLTWSALQGIQTYPAAREAEANYRAVVASLRGIELGVRAEVEGAVIALREARERLKPAEAFLAAARETLRLAQERFAEGAGSTVEVTDAQALYAQAQLQLIQAQYDIEVARARMRKAIGIAPGGKEAQ